MKTSSSSLAVVACWCCAAATAAAAASSSNSSEDLSAMLPADRFFIDKIFNKYGDDNVISFEGFEHLLDNLGLGGRVFKSPHDLGLHKINGSFRQLHDVQHKHKRSVSVSEYLDDKTCLTPTQILKAYGLENVPMKKNMFLEVCPALVHQLDQGICNKVDVSPIKLERKWAWIYATLSIVVISATGLVGVAVVPLLKSAVFGYVLHFLVAVAVGTLCGDALLHLLPHALKSHKPHFDETEAVFKCSITFLTILLFYGLEAIMQLIHGEHSHDHSHAASPVADNKPEPPTPLEPRSVELGAMLPGSPPPLEELPMTSTALMVILGDGLHNLTDGLAIGAAFCGDPVTGFATALAVFCHELPHELGDFAVLLRSGMSIRRALYYNLLSSVLSLMGMAAGLWLAEDQESASQWIYAATAGTFLYIGLADLVPELNLNNSGKGLNLLLALVGILCGGIIMLMIALHEGSLENLFRNFDQ